jgi:hypothetical protein
MKQQKSPDFINKHINISRGALAHIPKAKPKGDHEMKMNRIKLALPVLMIVAIMSVPVIVEAGVRWSRMDPALEMNGHTVNIFATWPEEHNCDIKGPIKFKMSAPGAKFLEDSKDAFRCENGERIVHTTKTKFSQRGEDSILNISARFRTSGVFPVGILVYVDGDLVQRCMGRSDKVVKCKPMEVN